MYNGFYIIIYLFFPGFFIKGSENWYGQNRTGHTARSGLAFSDDVYAKCELIKQGS